MALDYAGGIRLMPPDCGGGIRLFDKIPSLGERYVSDSISRRDKDDNKKREWTKEKEDEEAYLGLAAATEKLRQISLHEEEMSLAVAAERFRQRLRRRMRKRIKRPGLSQRKVTKFKHPPISQWRWRREKVTKASLDKKKVYFKHRRHGVTEYEEIPLSLAVEIFRGRRGDYDPAFLVPGQEKIDHKAWVKYIDQLYRSDRFDIQDYPGPAFAATVKPIGRNRMVLPEIREYATLGLSEYNTKEGENYQLKEIVTVNVEFTVGSIYYITCQAINRNAVAINRNAADAVAINRNAVEIFQIKIKAMIGRDVEVALCRKKP